MSNVKFLSRNLEVASINQSFNRSTDRSVNRSVSQSIDQAINQSNIVLFDKETA